MTQEPTTKEEKIKFLRYCVSQSNYNLTIHGYYDSERRRWMNFYLGKNGIISARDRYTKMTKYTMSIEEFADKFDEDVLDFAVKKAKLILIPKKSS
jgi:hypothetical protein